MVHYSPTGMGHNLSSVSSHSDGPPPGQTGAGAFLSPSSSTCLICYNAHVDVLLEPCHHQFHARCIEHALAKENVCPTCWTPVRTPRRLLTQQQQHYGVQMSLQQRGGLSHGNGSYSVDSKTHVLENRSSEVTLTSPSHSTSNSSSGSGSSSTTATTTTTIASATDSSRQTVRTGGAAAAVPVAVMRKGKWTAEESAYCDRLIEEFKKGNLPLAEGTTLRTFLSKLLHCDPMRISKKYTGDQCIGKIIFRRREDEVVKDDVEAIRKELAELEKTYLEREQYNQRRREKRLESELSRDKNRFAAARAMGYATTAVSGAATGGRSPHTPLPQQQQHQVQQRQGGGGFSPGSVQSMSQHDTRPILMQEPLNGGYCPISRGGGPLPVQPPLHPPQQPTHTASSHLFTGDHSSMAMLGIAGAPTTQSQGHGHAQDSRPSGGSNLSMDGSSTDTFPRVSSIDSFSCLFPRVASIDNFQHATSSGFGVLTSSGSYALTTEHLTSTSTSSGFDTPSPGLPKPLSIGESLNAYFPRIHSLEQLSHLLQDHGPNSPHGVMMAPNSRDAVEKNAEDTAKQQHIEESSSGSSRRKTGEKEVREEQHRDDDRVKTEPSACVSSNTSSSSVESSAAIGGTSSAAGSGGTKRLSPSHNAAASSGLGNQIQIPKPLNKMPRSSSGIFPRVPSMDKMPQTASVDKLPRVASLEKLPRIPSMDKLHSVGGSEQRIPRVPSSDMMARVPSSDMLSRFGSSDHLSSFPSFSNLSALSSSASYDKLSSLGGFKSGFPRNSSIEDILSLVASSESTGLSSNGSTLQLSALAAVAGEESSHLANERKRRLESSQQDTPLTADNKKSKLSA
uniref:RING-type domain-containing protein n=1 Tax=Hyaloperonospora arabidopsidis (strain Emoy2) TaxID=559515 RepID=M4BJ05_HYAAE